jgi:hypothetical protein
VLNSVVADGRLKAVWEEWIPLLPFPLVGEGD